MMKAWKARKNKKGFTLMEMLIVVAIIAILVAIAIPTFGGALDQAKYNTDIANVRAWYAETQIELMTDSNKKAPEKYPEEEKFKLQLTDSQVAVSGGSASDFQVTYTPKDTDKFKTRTFGGDGKAVTDKTE